MKRIYYGLGCIAVLLAACGSNKNPYDATGTFEATEVTVSAEVSGRLLRFDLDEGSVLKAGQQVGLVDTVQLALMKQQQEANVQSVKSQVPDFDKQVAALKEQVATAEREKARIERLVAAGAANQKQLDDATSLVELYKKQLAAQMSTLKTNTRSLTEQSSAIDIQVAQLTDQLAKCNITAPITGTVLAKYMEAGELAAVGKPLFKMADTENMILRAYITSEQLQQVKVGDQVTVFADYGAEKRTEYPGVITWISDRAEFTPKTILTKDERANQVYAVKIAVGNDGYLKIGMYGGVKLAK